MAGARSRPAIPWTTLAFLVSLAALPSLASDMVLYDDALRNGWEDWSWGTHSLVATAYVHSGTRAVSFEPDGWNAFSPYRGGGVSGTDFDGFEFWVNGGGGSGQQVRVAFLSGGTELASTPLTAYLPGGPSAGTWRSVRIPFDDLGLGSATITRIYFQDQSGGNQAALYLDDLAFTERPGQGGPLTVSVDPAADRRPVSPYIYGVCYTDAAPTGMPAYPVRRWGGNATTRYSWQDDASNRAFDWFFINYPYDTNVSQLPDNSTADRFIDDARSHGSEPLVTVPLIGWTPRDRQVRWGFSQSKYGAQTNDECRESGWPGWCHEDAGNGVLASGGDVTGNDPLDTSRAVGTSFVTGWMAHIASRVGSAGSGGVKFFALDNEPMLWNSTHRDVHPTAVDYAEIWQRTRDYAAAMKAQDPAILTLGPAVWGWCAYFYSAHDECSPGSDYSAHGPFLEWYLSQVESYRQAHGVRLVDYLDVHCYPQAANVALTQDESEGTAALRLRSLKGLYDPSYSDESWIGQPIYLISRMRQIIAENAPGTKLAITEYNWGDGAGASSALAQAEALALFGREGVDLATRWVEPGVNTLLEDAFKLYLNYDGAGSKVEGESVRATSSNVNAVGAYTVRRGDGRLYFLFFNKDTQARAVDVTVAGTLTGTLSLYGFDASHRLQAMGSVTPGASSFSLELPARSARLAVGQGPCALPVAVAGVTLHKAGGGAQLNLRWTDLSGATQYEVFEDASPGGAFTTSSGTASSGDPGLTIAMPSGTRYYLVAARNACGTGPK